MLSRGCTCSPSPPHLQLCGLQWTLATGVCSAACKCTAGGASPKFMHSGEVGVSLWSLSWHIAFLQQQMIGLDSSAVIGFQWAGEGGSEKGLRQLASTNVYSFGVKAGEICKGSIVAVLSFFFSVEKSAGFVCSVCHCKS